MSSTNSETAPARPARWRALIALFGVAMFVIGVGIGGLGLPRLLALNPDVTPQASVVAQVPLATATSGAAASVVTTAVASVTVTETVPPPTTTVPPPTATVAPTATIPPATATVPPPTATIPPTATVAPTPTTPSSAIFAPDPQATGTITAPTAAAGTATSGPTVTATTATATPSTTATASATGTATITPTVTPTSAAFAATDRINTELPVNFRAGPGTTYAAQTTLPPGTLLAATGETQTTDGVVWQQFRLASGAIGWVRAQDVLTVR